MSHNTSSTKSSSPSSSSSTCCHQNPEMARSAVYPGSGGAVAPMPSLMSHPPLQQIKPQQQHVNTVPYGVTAPLHSASWQTGSTTPSPTSSPGSSPTPSYSSPLQDFPCPYCHQVYKKVGHLNRHVLTHSGTRFACEVRGCDKTFSRLDNMRTHVKNMHPGAS